MGLSKLDRSFSFVYNAYQTNTTVLRNRKEGIVSRKHSPVR